MKVNKQRKLDQANVGEKQAVSEQLAHRFRQVKSNPGMCQLHKMLLNYRLSNSTQLDIDTTSVSSVQPRSRVIGNPK